MAHNVFVQCVQETSFCSGKKYCASRVGIRTGDGKLSFAQQHGAVLD